MSNEIPLILIVEDDPALAELAQAVLGELEVTTHHCPSAILALEFLEDNTPDMFMLDIGMAEMSGWQLLDRIKADDELSQKPVIMATAFSDPANRVVGKLQRVDHYLVKPYLPSDLIKIVKELLNLG